MNGLIINKMAKTQDELIEEIRKRVEMGVDVSDLAKDLYYKGIRKMEVGMDLINKARLELEITGKWDTRLRNSYASNKKWRRSHSEKVKAYQREWRKNNPNYGREWRKKHPDYKKNKK